jgi:hypothetical protein
MKLLLKGATGQTEDIMQITSPVSGTANFIVDNKAHLEATLLTSGFFADTADRTKRLSLILSGLPTSNDRTWTVGNYSGYPAVPTDEGTAGLFLKSAGAAAQPIWSIATLFSFALTTDDNVNNSTTETDITNAGGQGSLAVNGATAGRTVRVTGSGVIGNIVNDNIQLRLKHGSTTVLDTGTFVLGSANTHWRFTIDLTWRSTTTVSASGWVEILDASTNTVTYLPWGASAVSVSTTGDISLTAQWSGAGAPSASDTITTTNFTVETIR